MKRLWAWFKLMRYNSKAKALMKSIIKAEKPNKECRQKYRRIMRTFNKQLRYI
jgi:hypothetical protein